MPARNVAFWNEKFNKTVLRDKKNRKALKQDGWDVLTIWECELKNKIALMEKLRNFLDE